VKTLKIKTHKPSLKKSTASVLKILRSSTYDLPTALNLSSVSNFGSCLGLVLLIQLSSGLILAMHYSCDVDLAFDSISKILREVNIGWLLRSSHANGASFFFILLYLHIGRGLYYGSMAYRSTYLVGVALMSTIIGASFLGYVLPWGQIRFWAATVITNLFSTLPYVGPTFVSWLWGGFAVGNPTLTRFFALHFLLPFVISALSIIHIFHLHAFGSTNPLGVVCAPEKVPFHRYYTLKDILGFYVLLLFFRFVVFFVPQIFAEVDNFVPANPLTTPSHIVPEWYFLFAYSILRCMPSKLGGTIGLFLGVTCLLFRIPGINGFIKGLVFYGVVKGYY